MWIKRINLGGTVQKSEVNKRTFRSNWMSDRMSVWSGLVNMIYNGNNAQNLYIGINAISGMVTNEQLGEPRASLLVEQ